MQPSNFLGQWSVTAWRGYVEQNRTSVTLLVVSACTCVSVVLGCHHLAWWNQRMMHAYMHVSLVIDFVCNISLLHYWLEIIWLVAGCHCTALRPKPVWPYCWIISLCLLSNLWVCTPSTIGTRQVKCHRSSCTYQSPQCAAQDQHPDLNSMKQLDSTLDI
jgi:hypothetical protein